MYRTSISEASGEQQAMCSLSSTTTIDHERAQPRPRLLHEYFERQAAARPAHTAVESDDEMLTYRQLDRMSNQIAHWLKAHGTGPGSLVGISMEKSCRLFAAMLGILKSGAGYVPIDPRLPLDRVRSIVDDAGIDIVLTGAMSASSCCWAIPSRFSRSSRI